MSFKKTQSNKIHWCLFFNSASWSFPKWSFCLVY